MLLWPFNKYPGTDYETFNWEWLIDLGKKIEAWAKNIMEYLTRAETAADDAETAAAIAEAAKNTILSRYYTTPQAYGAVGDGVTDDTAAIQEMFNDTDAPVYFPEGEYLITNGITDPERDRPLFMDGSIIYNGPATALTVTNKYNQFIGIDVQSTNNDYIPNSVGADVKNCNNCTIILKRAKNFETGVVFEGNNSSFAYNKIWVMQVLNNLHGVVAKAAGAGWVNENQWFGGRYAVESNLAWRSTAEGFILEGSAGHIANNNTLYNPSFEGIRTGLRFAYAAFNRVKAIRAEGVATPFESANSNYNDIEIGYGSDAGYVQGVNTVTNHVQTNMAKFENAIHIPVVGRVANNNDYAVAEGLQGLNNGNLVEYIYKGVVGSNGGLELTGRNAAVRLEIDPEALYWFKIDQTSASRIGFIMYDENDDIVDESPIAMSYQGGTTSMQKSTSGEFQGGYITGSDVTGSGIYVKFPENVKSVVTGFGTTIGLTSEILNVDIYSTKPGMKLLTPKLSALWGTAAPTSTGYPGQIVTSKSGTSYIWDGTAWKAITVT